MYAPNSKGGPHADVARYGAAGGLAHRRRHGPDGVHAARGGRRLGPGRAPWSARSWTTRSASRLVDNVVGHLLNGVTEPVLERAFEYWRNVDKDLGDRIESGVRAKSGEKDPKAADQGNPARSSMQHKA